MVGGSVYSMNRQSQGEAGNGINKNRKTHKVWTPRLPIPTILGFRHYHRNGKMFLKGVPMLLWGEWLVEYPRLIVTKYLRVPIAPGKWYDFSYVPFSRRMQD